MAAPHTTFIIKLPVVARGGHTHIGRFDDFLNLVLLTTNIINGFGNLAMISQSFNSLQSNDNIRVKFARIQEQLDNKSLQSLKMLVMFRSANEDHSKWSEQLALDNLEKMCSLLEKTAFITEHVSSETR